MGRRISVGLLPELIDSQSLVGSAVVVVDVLRATSTMIQAAVNGALEILPAADIPSARAMKQMYGPDTILGGERQGVLIPGFDQGNSPREYTPELIANKRLVLCTTNGTLALHLCNAADRVLIGAFTNLSSVAQQLDGCDKVAIVCAGTDGRITSEDVLFAGALVEKLTNPGKLQMDDQAQIAWGCWQTAKVQLADGKSLEQLLSFGAGGRNLVQLGYHHDVQFCANIDCTPYVPQRRSRNPLQFR